MNKSEDIQKRSLVGQIKPILIGVLVAVVAGGVVYGLGWWQGRSSVDTHEQKLETIKTDLQTKQQQINQLKNRSYLMQARAALFHTAVDLDQRNFGVANSHLQEAATALAQVKDYQNQINMTKLSQLQKNIAQTNINVAVNLEAQRQKILNFVTDLNKLIPEEFNHLPNKTGN